MANQRGVLNGRGADAIGIVDDTERLPQLALGLVVPASTARELWGPPRGADAASMIVKTSLGASQVVSRQTPLALRPDAPQSFRATAALDPTSLRRTVEGSVNSVLLSVAVVAVVVGAIGIANTSLVAVLERRNEIGLRRALGARRRHIAGQFLVESTLLGLLGGMIGTALSCSSRFPWPSPATGPPCSPRSSRRWHRSPGPWSASRRLVPGVARGLSAAGRRAPPYPHLT